MTGSRSAVGISSQHCRHDRQAPRLACHQSERSPRCATAPPSSCEVDRRAEGVSLQTSEPRSPVAQANTGHDHDPQPRPMVAGLSVLVISQERRGAPRRSTIVSPGRFLAIARYRSQGPRSRLGPVVLRPRFPLTEGRARRAAESTRSRGSETSRERRGGRDDPAAPSDAPARRAMRESATVAARLSLWTVAVAQMERDP